MYTTELSKIREQLKSVLAFIDPAYVDALLLLHKKLAAQHIDWAVSGDLGEALRTVQVQPDCIEIVTTKKGAIQIFLAVKERATKGVFYQIQRLGRDATVAGKEYPVYVRSHYFDFILNGVKIKVFGDPQYRVGNWEWGDKLEFAPEHIYVVGAKTAVVPLQVKYDIYQSLGWTDRVEKISQVINRRPSIVR
jgi:hypothetical protein